MGGLSEDDVTRLAAKDDDAKAREMVTHEWCLSLTQSDLQHQMKFDVVHPLLDSCSELGSTGVRNKCLEVGAVRIGEVARQFWDEEMSSCSKVIDKATAKSLTDLMMAIHRFKIQNHNSATDKLFERFL